VGVTATVATSRLLAQAAAGLAFLVGVVGAAVFGAAGTLDYREAWIYLAVFTVCIVAITADLARRDPALLGRRVKAGPLAEPGAVQKIIQSLAGLSFIAVFVLAGLDHRAGWSEVPEPLALAANALVALGLAIVFAVFRANTFTSAVVDVEAEQHVVSTGPYAVVRHPMYTGALVMLLGTPIALGSWWALCPVVVLAGVIVWRLLAEEKLLATELVGYAEYREKVRRRLVPFVW
jgi:protein-S-isoprenylcysteine O-methyltransferase Ste14